MDSNTHENKTVIEGLTQVETSRTLRENTINTHESIGSLKTFRDYKVLSQLPAQGGEADIYIVSKNNNRYVLKLYRYGIDPNLEALRKIQKITEENPSEFINIIEIGKEGNNFFEIMEEASFGNLDKLIKSKELNISNIYLLVESINKSLEVLHKNNIIHRDLKPSNILIKNNNPFEFALADFGISSVIEEGFSKKLTSKKGTELYWAPEASAGVVRKESDYFSLGVIVLEMILGKHPLLGLNEQLIIATMRTKGISVPEEIDSNLKTLIKGLVTRDPGKRWSYEEVSKWLKGEKNIPVYHETENVEKYSTPLPYEGEKFYSLEDLINKYIQKENGWETIKKLILRGNISTWLQQNSLHDEANKLDDLREIHDNPDLIVSLFLATFVPDLEFNLFGKVINLNNLNLFLGKYLRKESDENENKIIDMAWNSSLFQYLDEFIKISINYDRELLNIKSQITKYKNTPLDNSRLKSIKDSIDIYMEKDNYIFPFNPKLDNESNLNLFFSNYEYSLDRNVYEDILNNCYVPDIFLRLWEKDNLKILKTIKEESINYIDKNFNRDIFLPEEYVNIEKLELLKYIELGKFIVNNNKILKIENSIINYILPIEFININNVSLLEFRKINEIWIKLEGKLISKKEYIELQNNYILFEELNMLESLTSDKYVKVFPNKDKLMSKKEYIALKEKYVLFLELENLEQLTFDRYIEAISNKDKIIEKELYNEYLNEYILPKELTILNKELPLKEYSVLVKKLLDVKDKLISVSEYENIKDKYILCEEFNNLETLLLDDYLIMLSKKDILLEKDIYNEYLSEYVFPEELNNLAKKNLKLDQYIKAIVIFSKKESFLSFKEYRELNENYILPVEFKELSTFNYKNYLNILTYREILIEKKFYNKYLNYYIFPKDLSSLINEYLPLKKYIKIIDIFDKKELFISLKEYKKLADNCIIFREFKELAKFNYEQYLNILTYKEVLIEKKLYNEYLLPKEFKNLEKSYAKEYAEVMRILNSNKSDLISKKKYLEMKEKYVLTKELNNIESLSIEDFCKALYFSERKFLLLEKNIYNEYLENYKMPEDFINLHQLGKNNYLQVTESFSRNKNLFFKNEKYEKLVNKFLLPYDLRNISSTSTELYLIALNFIKNKYIYKKDLKFIEENRMRYGTLQEYLGTMKKLEEYGYKLKQENIDNMRDKAVILLPLFILLVFILLVKLNS